MAFVLYRVAASSANVANSLPADFIVEFRDEESQPDPVPEGYLVASTEDFEILYGQNGAKLAAFRETQHEAWVKDAAAREEANAALRQKEAQQRKDFADFVAWREQKEAAEKAATDAERAAEVAAKIAEAKKASEDKG